LFTQKNPKNVKNPKKKIPKKTPENPKYPKKIRKNQENLQKSENPKKSKDFFKDLNLQKSEKIQKKSKIFFGKNQKNPRKNPKIFLRIQNPYTLFGSEQPLVHIAILFNSSIAAGGHKCEKSIFNWPAC
jgi:hypothetical protein